MKLKALKPLLKKMNNEEFKFIINKIEKARQYLSTIFKMVYAESVHAIWMERNQRVLEKKSKGCDQNAKEIAYSRCVRATPRIRILLDKF